MTKNNIIHDLKEAKTARRKELAGLSFPKKIMILIRLQKLVNSVNKIKGRHPILVWKI